MIRVVSVRGLNRPEQRAAVTYVGRPCYGWQGHPLGNPYRPGQVPDPLDRYRAWLLARPALEADLAALWAETGQGARPLGCWCCSATAGDGSPLVCHAQILAELLRERFTQEGQGCPVATTSGGGS